MILPCVKEKFDSRCKEGLEVIKSSLLPFDEVGIFGSYARGEYTPSSDIDFCIVSDISRQDMRFLIMRDKLESLGCDCILVTPDMFKTSCTKFYINLRRDYRRYL